MTGLLTSKKKEMTEEEALEYLRDANSRTDRYAHIVDMDTFEARTADKRDDGEDTVDVYREFSLSDQRTRVQFIENMRRIFSGQSGVLGKYRIRETQTTVIGVGVIPQSALYRQHNNWPIVWLICGTVLLLAVVDGIYILSINRRLRATVKVAEEASAAKTQFLSSMSHDIRTPLNAVLGMTELAKKRANEPQYVEECLNKISVSGAHLLTLINDILEISKVESGEVALNPVAFSVEELVSSMESIIRSQATGHGLNFEVEIGPLLKPYLLGDKLRLSQIYLNLLTNAVKYTNPGGTVRLEVQEEPGETGETADLICVVKDNGIGMSGEFQKTMYDSFSRASDSRIDKIQGTGLGLAIAKRMTEQMDGTIECVSQLGEGTTFTVRIELPAAAREDLPQTEATDEDAKSWDLKGVRILVAEDNDLNWEIIQAMLEEQGIQCDRAENGQLCIDALTAQPPRTYAMVLMDIQMPMLNGRVVLGFVRLDGRTGGLCPAAGHRSSRRSGSRRLFRQL